MVFEGCVYGSEGTGGKFGLFLMSFVYPMSLKHMDIMSLKSSSKQSGLSFVLFEISASCKIILKTGEESQEKKSSYYFAELQATSQYLS